MWDDLVHLTWLGRRERIWYAMRRIFVADAPNMERCIMGYPISPGMRCPRYSLPGSLWCKRHIDGKRT